MINNKIGTIVSWVVGLKRAITSHLEKRVSLCCMYVHSLQSFIQFLNVALVGKEVFNLPSNKSAVFPEGVRTYFVYYTMSLQCT